LSSHRLKRKLFQGYLDSQDISIEYAVDAYIKMCDDMLKSQIFFMKTGKYPLQQQDQALEQVYSNETEMKSYMVGLAISQFLWPTHYQMFSFLKDALKENSDAASSYLEIGPGHGLFLREAMQRLKNAERISAVDISKVSIELAKSIMIYFHGDDSLKIEYHNVDMLDIALSERYDFITMGEVLEHVNHPEKLLCKLKDLLTAKGTAFISTCVDAPSIDHVYHFTSVGQIRDMFNECGLIIRDERILPVEDLPMEEIIKRKITINYCATVGCK